MTPATASTAPVPTVAMEFLVDHDLAKPREEQVWTPLTGGVSSELWRVELPGRALCVKGALAKLKVSGAWEAPISRNAVEWNWLTFAAEVVPEQVPVPLAHDPDRGLFAMSYLPADSHPVWKQQLMAGSVYPRTAAAVGQLIGSLHAAGAGDQTLAARFATDDNFEQLRIRPYLRVTAEKHPDLADHFDAIIARTTTTRRTVVHGDVSPKNILLGTSGPVLLDAECAWYGDPAFDVAFVLTHLVLKSLVIPERTSELASSAEALISAYREQVTWESDTDVLDRAGDLLPALLLARVDGLSPVEYLQSSQQARVRSVSRAMLHADPQSIPQGITSAFDALTAPLTH